MLEDWDIYGNQTDQWGYTRYSLAVHVPTAFANKVMAFRKAIGLADLTSEPHVSISASLYQPTDLEEVKRRMTQTALLASRFRIRFEEQPVKHMSSAGVLAVAPTEELLVLRGLMQEAVADVIQTVGDPNRPYHPHVTLYQGADADEVARAKEMAGNFDFGNGFDVASIELVGRVGPPRGGTREIITSFAFT